MKKTGRFVLALLLAFSFVQNVFANEKNVSTMVIENNSILEKNSILLKGPWDFYWGRFIDPLDYNAEPDLQVVLPDKWNNYQINEEQEEIAQEGKGAATYRLRIIGLKADTSYAFYTYKIASTAFTCYANGEEIFYDGYISEDYNETEPGCSMDIAKFRTDNHGSVILTFHVSNEFHRDGGLRHPVKLREENSLRKHFNREFGSNCIITGILLIISLYGLILSILKKDRSNLYLALFAFTIFLRVANADFSIMCYLLPEIDYSLLLKMEYTVIFLAPAFFTLYIESLNPNIFKYIKTIFICLPEFIFALITYFAPIGFSNKLIPVMQIYMFAVLGLDFILLLINLIRKKDHISNSLLISLIILAFGCFYDIVLIDSLKIDFLNGIKILPACFALYLICQASILAHIQNQNQFRIEQLNEHLTETNKAYYRFVPKEFLDLLSKKDITELSLGEWKSKKMMLMSADIRNFTSISETLTEIQLFDMLNSYLKVIAPVIRKYGGIIEKYLGDGIIAIFPNSAENGLNCAIEMQEQMVKLREDFKQKDLPELRIGIGLHYGNIVIGTTGDSERMNEITISQNMETVVKTEAATKIYKRPILVTKDAILAGAVVARRNNHTFNFYHSKIQDENLGELYALYTKVTGKAL